MIELETETAADGRGEATRVIRVTGKGVWNPHHPHRVLVRSDGSMVLQAEATVIAARPIANARDECAGTVAIGDRIEVDGDVFVVMARPMADPMLVPEPDEDVEAGSFAPEPWEVTDGIDTPDYGS